MNEHIELKRCPFCGSPARMHQDVVWGGFFVSCENSMECEVRTMTDSAPDEVAKIWNKRVAGG